MCATCSAQGDGHRECDAQVFRDLVATPRWVAEFGRSKGNAGRSLCSVFFAKVVDAYCGYLSSWVPQVLLYGIPCEASSRSRETDSDQLKLAARGGRRLVGVQGHPRAVFLLCSHSLLPQLAAPVSLKLPTGSEEWLDDRRTRGVAELCEKTPYRGAIPVGARGGLGVNRVIAG
ncbi:hypothetical protein Taro_033731, partial [Colocasia esculenta]|nr:hypothetical protein [Colocasia esculenta]